MSAVNVTAALQRDEAAGELALSFEVQFHHGNRVQSPLNLGALPLIGLDTSEAVGVQGTHARVVQRGRQQSGGGAEGAGAQPERARVCGLRLRL